LNVLLHYLVKDMAPFLTQDGHGLRFLWHSILAPILLDLVSGAARTASLGKMNSSGLGATDFDTAREYKYKYKYLLTLLRPKGRTT